MRRLLIVGVVELVAGCATSESSPNVSPVESAVIATPTASPEALATVAPASFKDIKLAGKGDRIAKFKTPADAAAIAVATHAGKANFVVETLDASGKQLGLLVNTIGKYRGTTLFDVNAGEHAAAFKITADGPWTITVKPVAEAPVWDSTKPLKGVGDGVYVLSPGASGLTTLDLTFRGSGNFVVTAYTADSSDLLANEIGTYAGQVQLPDGAVLLEVVATGGTWTAVPG
jgi:hypothetical protein